MLISYVSRVDKMALIHLSRSSVYLNAVSNRLAASSPRARFLGMVYGTAMSELVDPQDKRMTFSAEEMNSSEGRWYKSLTSVNDPIGSIEDLKHTLALSINAGTKTTKLASSNGKSTKSTGPANKKSKILSIKEIVDNSESETEELPMYEKPDSDPSDEDEDPTIVQRNRTVAPV